MSPLSSTSNSPDDVRLRDPLSEVTRRERRSLLGVSMVGIAVVHAGLIPSEISSFGMKLTQSNQAALLFLIGVICFYYLIAFVAYAASDYVAWKVALRESITNAWLESRQEPPGNEDDEANREDRFQRLEVFMAKHEPLLHAIDVFVLPVSKVRAILEFGLPCFVGVYAVVILVLRSAA